MSVHISCQVRLPLPKNICTMSSMPYKIAKMRRAAKIHRRVVIPPDSDSTGVEVNNPTGDTISLTKIAKKSTRPRNRPSVIKLTLIQRDEAHHDFKYKKYDWPISAVYVPDGIRADDDPPTMTYIDRDIVCSVLTSIDPDDPIIDVGSDVGSLLDDTTMLRPIAVRFFDQWYQLSYLVALDPIVRLTFTKTDLVSRIQTNKPIDQKVMDQLSQMAIIRLNAARQGRGYKQVVVAQQEALNMIQTDVMRKQ